MDLIKRIEEFKLAHNDIEEVKYLKQKEIGGVLSKGLAELATRRPNNPITYLATWLLNESKSYEIKRHQEYQEEMKQHLDAIKLDKEKKKLQETRLAAFNADNEARLRNNLKAFIGDTKDMDDILNEVCNKLKEYTAAKGVYIAYYEQNRKTVDLKSDHEAHLDSEEVIRYVFYCDDHAFLKGQFIPKDKGITYDIFLEEETDNKQDNVSEHSMLKPPEEEVKVKIVEEVVRESRMHYFQEPQLGAYVAMNISYKNCLFPSCLKSAIENYKLYKTALAEYNVKVADYQTRKGDYELVIAPEDAERKDTDEKHNTTAKNVKQVEEVRPSQEEIDQKLEEFRIEWEALENEKPSLLEHTYFLKKVVLCLDTIGQDRMFSAEQLNYAKQVALKIIHSWENLESKQLIKDRDIRIRAAELEQAYIDEVPADKLPSLEEKYIKEYLDTKYADELLFKQTLDK